MIGAADIGVGKVGTAAREHRRAAVTAEEVAGVVVGVLLLTAVVGGRALLQKFLGNGKGAVVNNRLVMVFKHDMLAFVKRHIVSVYLFPLEFVLAQCADIKVVAENFGDGHDAP